MNGIVIVDKPQDWTSQDVTARLRRVFNTRRIAEFIILVMWLVNDLPGNFTDQTYFFPSQVIMSSKILFNVQSWHKEL